MELGFDGKSRAATAAATGSTTAITNLYLGLLEVLPAGYAGLSLTALLDAGGDDNELNITNFYTSSDRLQINLSAITVDSDGGRFTNTGSLSWANTSGATVGVGGYFVTDSASPATDGSGQSLWVGSAVAGHASVDDTKSLTIEVGGLTLRVK